MKSTSQFPAWQPTAEIGEVFDGFDSYAKAHGELTIKEIREILSECFLPEAPE